MTNQLTSSTTESFIASSLDDELCLLFAKDYVQEVITARPEQIVPIPNMSTCIIGLLHHRQNNYWLVDFATMLGYAPLSTETDFHQIILISKGKKFLGLIFKQVEGIQNIDPEEIYPTVLPHTSPLLKPYLRGYYQDGLRVQYVINPDYILNSSMLHN
ncbi:MAG: chemotaxis protein CheW [Pseudanabaena sp. ELA607]|jgi:chemotaxis signal transduction protein